MSSQTTNLHLTKPDATDAINIADINGNMDILDSAVPQAGVSMLKRGRSLSPTSTNHLSLHTLCTDTVNYGVGRYYVGGSSIAYIDDKPSEITQGVEITVEENQLENRFIITLTVNSGTVTGVIFKQWYTGSGWSSWYKFEGTAVT